MAQWHGLDIGAAGEVRMAHRGMRIAGRAGKRSAKRADLGISRDMEQSPHNGVKRSDAVVMAIGSGM